LPHAGVFFRLVFSYHEKWRGGKNDLAVKRKSQRFDHSGARLPGAFAESFWNELRV
jgi:hypothetical protein